MRRDVKPIMHVGTRIKHTVVHANQRPGSGPLCPLGLGDIAGETLRSSPPISMVAEVEMLVSSSARDCAHSTGMALLHMFLPPYELIAPHATIGDSGLQYRMVAAPTV